MIALILIFGLAMLVAGGVLAVRPGVLLAWLRPRANAGWLHGLAVVVRLLLGGLLVYAAHLSRFPLAIATLGWLALAAGLGLAVIGRARFRRLMAWALGMPESLARVGGVLAALFGAFVLYAFR